jgi:hypothetical protein
MVFSLEKYAVIDVKESMFDEDRRKVEDEGEVSLWM